MDKKSCKVALTGGGTLGHVMPHVALLPEIQGHHWEVFYIGSDGKEREIISALGVKFYKISVGKLRRYFSFENFKDIFRVFLGIVQSLRILLAERPHVVFSKGGFVSVPVAVAAWLLRIPVVSHESDMTPGLANRIIARFAKQLLYCFPETKQFLGAKNASLVGLPVRKELFAGERSRAIKYCGFDDKAYLPTLLFMGGSQGAKAINDAVGEIVCELVKDYWVIHLTGIGKKQNFVHENYCQIEFVTSELADLLDLADIVICRAGANTIFELRALRKPMILIPLEKGSRGDQLDNARSFQRNHWATMIREEDLAKGNLKKEIDAYKARMSTDSCISDSVESSRPSEMMIFEVLQKVAGCS